MSASRIRFAAFTASWLTLSYAVHLSELFVSTDYPFYPNQAHVYPDGSLLLSAESSQNVAELSLHPSVAVEETSDPFAQTNLLARVDPATSDVIWAAAISSLKTFEVTTVDADGNAYMLGMLNTDDLNEPIAIIKFAPDGTRLWSRHTGDGLSGISFPTGVTVDGFSGDVFGYVDPGLLYVAGKTVSSTGEVTFHAFRFDAATGDYLGSISFPRPAFAEGQAVEKLDFTVNSAMGVMCIISRVSDMLRILDSPVVQCTPLSGDGIVASRKLEQPDPKVNVFGIAAVLEEGSASNGRPSLRLIYERAIGFNNRESVGRHELVMHKLDVTTMEEIDWQEKKEGEGESGSVEPLVIRLPTPFHPTAAVDIARILHAKRSNAVLALMNAFVDIVGFNPSKPGQDDGIQGDPSVYVDPPVPWAFSIDEKVGQMRSLALDPLAPPIPGGYNHMYVVDLALSEDEKTTYVYGLVEKMVDGNGVESGPLYFYTTPTFLEKRATVHI